MFTITSTSNRVSLLGQYANPDTTAHAAVVKQTKRLMRRNAVRRYNRRIESINRYLSQVMPEMRP
ncbi:hypothetical protein [Spirosoma linguale]|uniref:hypothetical protein n=1 Tax=Spirosoma linguale TaxID=108 RepID=UPI003CC7CD18